MQPEEIATRLHSAAIRLLRLVRREDRETGLSGPRLSALSVAVFAGPMSLAELAAEEQVRAPTMTRTVDALVEAGLVTRERDPHDRRMVRIAATEEGRRLLDSGRRRRVQAITARLAPLAESERRALERGVELMERLAR
ncbi:MarR family winged helix-turn-helix transcriptional regulator [Allosphingosinicella sp.]|jgi:DNA-binding MarR family transcriptional regulator|uniref:MarR family winged helix-turn-helix transcriptional regulator n=1 Tax=Allosphingosinicella sp. TaxID=2823234 RepID=UPI002F15B81F